MDLRDYPRPKDDTGIGVHWNAGFPAAIGLGQIRDVWLPELIAMGVKWVKIARHDGGMAFAELLLKHDIMPIVRLYRPQPNPSTLDEEMLRGVVDYVASGVRYFEFNNEPDLGVEWQNGFVPPAAPQIVARNAIIDMEAILARGGYPGIPALATGARWDIVGEICKLGRRDLLREPVWQAIHNYCLNHPLDYPYDAGNQQGAAYTREFYDRLAVEKWDGDAWGGRSLERVNQERADHANPGVIAFDDPSCWRAYERYDRLIRDQIGRSLPLLATENGYIVGERPDPRYPATTPQLHMANTLEACRTMMGTSSRFDHAPDYFLCTAFWLLGNYSLGHWAPGWEGQAWYSGRWPGGQLPIVAALKAEPKQTRAWRGDGGLAGRVGGVVQSGAGLTLSLTRADGWALRAKVEADNSYEFLDLPLAAYRVTPDLGGTGVADKWGVSVTVTRERPAATANLDLAELIAHLEMSVVRGDVRGGAGLTVRLARVGDGWVAEQAVAQDGSYCFSGVAAGSYVLGLFGTPIVRAGIELNGHNEAVIDLVAPGWGWETADGGASPGFGVVRCRVTDRTDLPVRLWTEGWPGMIQRTGSKREYGADACEFAPLGAGSYTVQPEGIDARAAVKVDGSRVTWVTYTESKVSPVQASLLSGHVRGGAGMTLQLTGPQDEQTVVVADDASYRFADLPAGIYRLAIEDTAVARDDIVLDGQNQVTVDLDAPAKPDEPPPPAGVIFGTVTHGAGHDVQLLLPPATAVIATAQASADGHYRFEHLAPGAYTVQVMAAEPAADVAQARSGVEVDGQTPVQVDFTLPEPAATWGWAVEDGGPGPGFSLVRCQVAGEPHREVRLWTSGWGGITQRTGSKLEYGPDVCEFAPLGPGAYTVAPQGLDVQADVRLAANRVAWVRFHPPAPQPLEPTPPPQASIIAGGVIHGEGLPVLLVGPEWEMRTAVADGRYRFEDLAAGTYRVAVLAAPPAQGVLASRDAVEVNGLDQVTVDFELPAPMAQAASRVFGRVRGGAGRTVVLEVEGALDDSAASAPRRTTVAEDETYSFADLPAGVYRATVADTDPPTGATQFQAGIELDGANSVEVDFDLGALGPGKTADHYLLVGSIARSRDDFLTVLQYVTCFQPIIGSDEAEARQARHVTILGSTGAVSALVEQGLRMSGCQVQRIDGDYAEKLGQLVAEGRPY